MLRGASPVIRRLAKVARRARWTVEATRGDHVRFRSPEGVLVVASQTPSDSRAWLAVRSRLRRAGLKV